MHFERIKTPGLAHVAYLIGNQGEAAVVDPRRDVDEYLTLARKHKLTIKYSIETHRQEDFVMGSAELARQCGAKVVNGRHKAFGHGDIRLDDGEGFEIAKGIRIVALHTPGHAPDHLCFLEPRSGLQIQHLHPLPRQDPRRLHQRHRQGDDLQHGCGGRRHDVRVPV